MEPFDDQTRLICALFAETQAHNLEAWSGFLSLLRQLTKAEGASLELNLKNQTRIWFDGTPKDGDRLLSHKLRFDRVYSQESLPSWKENGAPTRMIKVRTTNGSGLTLGINRDAHARDFRSAEGQMLHGLAPFLGQAMDVWLNRQQENEDSKLGAKMLAALGGDWLILDRMGKVIRLSADVVTEFEVANGLPLEFADPEIASGFTKAFAQAMEGVESVAFSLNQGEMLLTQIEYDNAPAILGQLRMKRQSALIPPQTVAHHFGVSTSEARLAVLICDGHSLKAAAAMLGWTEESARTCSKSLFARMGVSGQPQLVSRILNSSVWYRGPR